MTRQRCRSIDRGYYTTETLVTDKPEEEWILLQQLPPWEAWAAVCRQIIQFICVRGGPESARCFSNRSPSLVSASSRGGQQRIPRPDGWRLGSPAPWPPNANIDLDAIERHLATRVVTSQRTGAPPPKRDSAVLIALYADPEVTVVLTRRTQNMRTHSGEVSFPGGAQDPGETLWETACEAREEVQLDTSLLRRIGFDHLTTVSWRSHSSVRLLDLNSTLTRRQPRRSRCNLRVPLSELLAFDVYRRNLEMAGINTRKTRLFL